MRTTAIAVTLAAVVSVAWSMPRGFCTDITKARQECEQTGKLVYLYFHLDN